jgi:branched-chain amino acid transport system ATP-binding protein
MRGIAPQECFDNAREYVARVRTRCGNGQGALLMSSPRLLMLDDPTLGLAPLLIDQMFELILSLVKTKRLTMLLVGQNVGDALQMCQRAHVMERGSITKTGPGYALLDDRDVRRAYTSI